VSIDAYYHQNDDDGGESYFKALETSGVIYYSSFLEPTKGTEWAEDDLPTLYPKLWAKFN
jgi:hypothetical protein